MKVDKNRVKIFYSYSHKDELLRDCFENHMSGLKRKGIIEEWYDRKILPGEFWNQSIKGNIENADIILFLVSSDFLASDYCYNIEVIKAIERHNQGLCKVVPIILRECDWEGTPFETIQGLPTDMKPVVSRYWHDSDEAFTNIVKGLKRIIHKTLQAKEFVESNFSLPDDNHNMNVNFRDLLTGRECAVSLEKNLTLSEAINELIKNKFLQAGNDYVCTSKLQMRDLDKASSFTDNSIKENDTILFGVKSYAG